jgi:1-acyl-sn-glycerol-3-phosphate acyltransferase
MPKLFGSCEIKIGRPIRPDRYRGRGAEHIAWRSMIDEVMYEIRELTGQTYVNTYAGAKAETEPTVAGRVSSVSDPVPDIMPPADVVERELSLVAGS